MQHKLNIRWSNDNGNKSLTLTQTIDAEVNRELVVADGTTHTSDIGMTATKIKSVFIQSDKAVTIVTKDDADMDVDTFDIPDGGGIGWQPDTGQECPFTDNFATMEITNAGDDPAHVNINIGYDD